MRIAIVEEKGEDIYIYILAGTRVRPAHACVVCARARLHEVNKCAGVVPFV